MNTFNLRLLAALISTGLVANVAAAVPNTFASGEAAVAADVNENFTYLDGRIDELESASSTGVTEVVDCDADADALADLLADAYYAGPLTVTVSGTCNGPVEINKDDVTIDGQSNTSIVSTTVDGEESESIFVAGKTNIKLQNMTISSGVVSVKREAAVRFEDVSLYTTSEEDSETTLYVPNVELRASSLRIESGSLDNLALDASFGSYVRISSDVTGQANSLLIQSASSLESRPALNVFGGIVALASASIEDKSGETSSAGFLGVIGSTVFLDTYSSSGSIQLHGGGMLNIDNDSEAETALTAGFMVCEGGHFYVNQGSTFTGYHSDFYEDGEYGNAGDSAVFQRGCSGEFDGDLSVEGTIYASNYVDVTWDDADGSTQEIQSHTSYSSGD